MNPLIDAMKTVSSIPSSRAREELSHFGQAVAIVLAEHGECRIPGVGVLKIVERAERKGRNPKTGEAIVIPARKALTFKPAAQLKRAIG